MNTPPFKVGQKVVALEDSEWGFFKKDEIYTVKAISKCRCSWIISIGKTIHTKSQICFICGHFNGLQGETAFHKAKRFAPIEESRSRISYVAVSESLRQTAVEIAAVETN